MEPWIEARELFARLSDDEVLVLDCRAENEWDRLAVRIPGALKMTLEEIAQNPQILPEDELIVLCDADGSSAQRACRMLRLRGFDAVCLFGGLSEWLSGGYPVEGEEVSIASLGTA